ncbi:Receptor-type guanylate cyclase gcy [Seminavis robusta]|uniref:Receptor-type guanylate cyclase gcy n=1 Tax=Seminavis robusta TaxID=568900 RepID=A0A9N8DD06_9STRA|nr:Receptor-type guanylate cyclase gcy [Seminavis robusta]|eukprot:Sro39_g023960.1 Receptor-type guanylate cyclase gcy (1350) ;mRNA; f:14786-20806
MTGLSDDEKECAKAVSFEDLNPRRKSVMISSIIKSSITDSSDQQAELMRSVILGRTNTTRDVFQDEEDDDADSDGGYSNVLSVVDSVGTSNGGGSGGVNKEQSDKEKETKKIQEELSKKESASVLYLRLLVIFVLVVTAAVVSSVVYLITRNGEVSEFETQYEGAAGKVTDAFENIMVRMESIAGLAAVYTSQGMHHNPWPFVSLEDFYPRARNALDISGSLWIGMHPLVPHQYYKAWDEFTMDPANYRWVTQALEYQQKRNIEPVEGTTIGVSNVSGYTTVVDPLHFLQPDGTAVLETDDQDWYLPRWQTSPFLHKAFVNENVRNNPREFATSNYKKKVLSHVVATGQAVASEFYSAEFGYANSSNPDTAFLANLRGLQAGLETPYHGDPMTDLYIPIFDTIDNSIDNPNRTVVGIMSSLVHWKSFFRYVLPQNVHGINAVLEYTCDGNTEADHANRDSSNRRTTQATKVDHANDRRAQTEFVIFPMQNNDTFPTESPTDVPSLDDAATRDEPLPADAATAVPTTSPTEAQTATEEDMPGTQFVGEESQFDIPHVTTEEPQDIHSESKYFTIVIEGVEAYAVGHGDLHERKFNQYERRASYVKNDFKMNDGTLSGIPIDQTCTYQLRVYPSQQFYDQYNTNQAWIITVVIACVFLFAIFMFWVYNLMVEHRQNKILKKATQTTALVSTLFPKNVRDRLLEQEESHSHTNKYGFGTKSRLKGFVAGETDSDSDVMSSSPIADLFPNCTVFFGDIAGFTAWSSTREPGQVFILLQNLYQTFDQLAKRRSVFKVETIGDCYMAVTGLPDKQPDHATIMSRFAFDCLVSMKEITKRLESTLGPDTTDLGMRIGLHSGPVTAGVLRGERARFQLFGDTVNTASRMESTGSKGRIQVSNSTAKILKAVGKDQWLTQREDAVKAKGKGIMRTYWMTPKKNDSSAGGSSVGDPAEQQSQNRLVDWIVSLMLDDIRKIVYDRKKVGGISNLMKGQAAPTFVPAKGTTCMEEVKTVIHMPKFDSTKQAHQMGKYKGISVEDDVVKELTAYVAAIAAIYRDNPFHNFEHACHVTMSVSKLLKRIVTPEIAANEISGSATQDKLALTLHDYTFGINSDPLAMFAMTFSALIHDVDHRGVSNMQLGVEDPAMKEKYDNKSLAEQNSLDISWDILMQERFSKLRSFVFGSQEELLRFRQLIVNIVLATDIFDKELNALRLSRWKHAFSEEKMEEDVRTKNDLRATIVIEHIMQASDVSHTMQHWHVYQKWNRCLFKEMHAAYLEGRMGKDPATFWYKGEIGFFDNYIIPLAKKLKDCGVFGVSSDEYLDYAEQNRAEWEERGQEIVEGMVAELSREAAALDC